MHPYPHQPSLSLVECVRGDVLPLIGGSSPREGFVEVCTDAGYLPVDIRTFTIREANVLCRQMNLGSGEQSLQYYSYSDIHIFHAQLVFLCLPLLIWRWAYWISFNS